MALKPLTKAEQDYESKMRDLMQDALSEDLLIILEHMTRDKQKKWGLPIVRCTYKSQERWEQFIAVFYRHIHQDFLNQDPENGPDLQSTLVCNVIKDRERLEGASWKEARKVFDEWVLQDMEAHPLGPILVGSLDEPKTPEEKFKEDIERSPYWHYFIYVDEESIASVLDTDTPKHLRRNSLGDYWITIVVTRLKGPLSIGNDEHGNMVDDFEDGGFWRNLYKRFKIFQFLRVYAVLANEHFNFDSFMMGKRDDKIFKPY